MGRYSVYTLRVEETSQGTALARSNFGAKCVISGHLCIRATTHLLVFLLLCQFFPAPPPPTPRASLGSWHNVTLITIKFLFKYYSYAQAFILWEFTFLMTKRNK